MATEGMNPLRTLGPCDMVCPPEVSMPLNRRDEAKLAIGSLQLGQIAPVAALAGLGIAAAVEWGRRPDRVFDLLLWLDASAPAHLVKAGEFWTEWHMGQPVWLRFKHAFTAFNQSAFEVAEVRLALDPAQRPPGVWWPRSAPRSQPT